MGLCPSSSILKHWSSAWGVHTLGVHENIKESFTGYVKLKNKLFNALLFGYNLFNLV
jgi:hypothetical protein